MRRASWTALLTIGMSLPGAVCAEDTEAAVDVVEPAEAPQQSWDLSSYEYLDEVPWYLAPRIDAPASPDDPPFADVDFQDTSALGRLSRLRSLSLLTFAEIGDGRLFFGVNGEGLLGLHFGAISEDGQQPEPELARMPYLDDVQLAGEDQ